MILNSPYISGSLTVTGNIIASGSITISGSIASASYASNADLLDGLDSTAFATTGAYSATSASLYSTSASLSTASGSFNTRVTALEATGSALSSSLLTVSGSGYATSASLSTDSGSFNSRVATIESKYATTGSNNFRAPQYISDTTVPTGFSNTTGSIYTDGGIQVTKDSYFSGSMFIKGNLTIYGTQSIAYITSSQLNIATNLITVNTATPAVRFGGLAVYDSGSTGTNMTGSLLWDSQNNSWLYNNPSGSGNYDSAMVIMGPRNASALGSEVGINCNYLMQGHGHHHTTSSMIFHDGTNTCVPNTLMGGTVCLSNGLVVQAAATFCNTVALMGGSSQLYIGGSAGASDYAILGWCATNKSLNIHNQSTGNSNQLVITCEGNVGIACIPTSYKLQVYQCDAALNTFRAQHVNGNAIMVNASYNYYDAYEHNFRCMGGGATYLTILNSGNVGIGQTSATAKLDVYAGADATSNTVLWGQTIRNEGNGAATGYGAGLKLKISSDGTPNEVYKWAGIAAVAGTNYSNRTDLALYANAASTSDATEKVRITGDGYVGIGTTSPGYPLEISYTGGYGLKIGTNDATSANNAAIFFSNDASATAASRRSYMLLDPNGGNGSGGDYTYLDMFGSGNATLMNQLSTGNLILGTAGTTRVFVCSSGNVGIGTNSPFGPLVVYKSNSGGLGGHIILNNNGAAVANETAVMFGDGGIDTIRAAISSTTEGSPYYGSLKFKTGLGTYDCLTTQMTITGAGNVGIGFSTVTNKLQVAGEITTHAGTNTSYYSYMNYLGTTWNFGSGEVSDAVNFKICGASASTAGNAFGFWTQPGNTTPLLRLKIDKNGYVGINNSCPRASLEVNQACSDVNNGGYMFKTMYIDDNVWTSFFTPPANWAGLTTFNWTGTNDYNRSGAAQIRWSYQSCAAQLGPTTTIFNDSQNAQPCWRYSGGDMQIYINGAGAGKRLQVMIMGSRGS